MRPNHAINAGDRFWEAKPSSAGNGLMLPPGGHWACLSAVLLVLLVLIGCGGPPPPVSAESQRVSQVPEFLLESNFRRATFVVAIRVDRVVVVDRYRSDDGRAGYERCLVDGRLVEIYKSPAGLASRLRYSFTREDTPGKPSFPPEGRIILAFLKRGDNGKGLWIIGEGAQFEWDPPLRAEIRKIAASQVRAPRNGAE